MNLRTVDLNLLVALDALLIEQHVTRAADRIGLSQPAMSSALNRLRHIFKDDLLVRTSAGMQATPRALELHEPLQKVLRQIERVIETEPEFEPTCSTQLFTVRLSDVLAALVLPPLTKALEETAPKIRLDIAHLPPPKTIEALEKDEIDLAISMGLQHSNAIENARLMPDRMICLMDRDHPLAGEDLTLDGFLAYRHIRVAISPTDFRFVDSQLMTRGLTREVALNLPNWLVVPYILRGTRMLAVMPERLAQAIAADDLVSADLPIESTEFEWTLYWHRRHRHNRAVTWLRDTILAVSA